jgi:hypothetical protein
MSDPAPDQDGPADERPHAAPVPPWLRAPLANLEGLDFEAPIAASKSADAHELRATFARGFLQFFQGDFVGATYILTPLLENSLRHVLKMSGYDVSIFDDATQTQEDRTISSLFEQMRPELDSVFTKAITMDIDSVFLRKPGPYLRHSVAHGLLHDGAPYSPDAIYGCWFMFRLCLLPLFPHRKQFQIPGQ